MREVQGRQVRVVPTGGHQSVEEAQIKEVYMYKQVGTLTHHTPTVMSAAPVKASAMDCHDNEAATVPVKVPGGG